MIGNKFLKYANIAVLISSIFMVYGLHFYSDKVQKLEGQVSFLEDANHQMMKDLEYNECEDTSTQDEFFEQKAQETLLRMMDIMLKDMEASRDH